jgi:hypothetical protein
MSTLRLIELTEAIGHLPALVPLDPNRLASPTGLFLCALGFEPRCITIPTLLADARHRARQVTYIQYSTNYADNAVNLPALQQSLSALGTLVEPLLADSPNFATRLRSLVGTLTASSQAEPPRLVLDISVLANRAILTCMKVLLETPVHLTVLYAEAAQYYPTREMFEARSEASDDQPVDLEFGVADVTISPEHPGLHLEALPDAVILFPSFKPQRSLAVLDRIDPSLRLSPGDKVVWLIGIPRLEADRWRLDAMRRLNSISEQAPQYQVSTFDYKDTIQTLHSIHEHLWDRYNITVAPMGSKLQALGTTLFSYMHPDVRVMFATPREYNARQYSRGCKATWHLDLGHLLDLRRTLDRVGTLVVDD